jgi:hypothetical protein
MEDVEKATGAVDGPNARPMPYRFGSRQAQAKSIGILPGIALLSAAC